MPQFEFNDRVEDVIVDAADFLRGVFWAEKWKWNGEIPSVKQIEEMLTRLTQKVIDTDCNWTGCGRLCIRRDAVEDGDKISFYLELGEVERIGHRYFANSINE